jgi:2-keto-4-pentenoate hydratase/2-oxohepta-3-ene-1,7-dioic acid hydratase in catechol pathway
VVIGTPARKLSKQQALDCIFGYTVINDISARDLQFRHEQFFIGKSLPGACPMGPWIVTADDIADPQNLNLRCRVNNDITQESNTHYMIFDVATIIASLSHSMVLEPGDIIATGTPSGVGFAQKPPRYLVPGDIVECEVAGIGRIRNRIAG